ncbi:MAG: 23S rRNA (adenine(2503)-C(2))-methyltransferase RlmN [Hyphomicrobiaceae bacterium]|nr:23S rRNA (adenine(2503)-C(2))-methyltransferase RlmN [Hyphomicrobiaceae bacterium]
MQPALDQTAASRGPAPASEATAPATGMRSIAGFDRSRLGEALANVGVPAKQVRMRVNQLWSWLYVRGVTSFDDMTDVSKELRLKLSERFTLDRPEIVSEQVSVDGTRKWLLRLPKRGHEVRAPEIETVYIPESDRGTLCISSQVGCTLNCSFCHTGTQRLVRNLEAEEIVAQILLARDRIGDWPGATPPGDGRLLPDTDRKITNIVLMGMGEPLYNFDNVRTAIEVASDGDGLSVSKRRITLSTSGVVPEIGRWGEEAGTMLAISLHAVTDVLRDELVPINKRYPIADLMEACRNYPGLSNARRITFEYVMLKGVNDRIADAKALVRLLEGIPAKINLIPFNPWPGTTYECSDWETIERFAEVVNRAGYASPVRTPRGRDILAACGQLKSASEKLRASERASAVPTAPASD